MWWRCLCTRWRANECPARAVRAPRAAAAGPGAVLIYKRRFFNQMENEDSSLENDDFGATRCWMQRVRACRSRCPSGDEIISACISGSEHGARDQSWGGQGFEPSIAYPSTCRSAVCLCIYMPAIDRSLSDCRGDSRKNEQGEKVGFPANLRLRQGFAFSQAKGPPTRGILDGAKSKLRAGAAGLEILSPYALHLR